MYTLTQILKDLAGESVPPPKMIRTVWERVLFSLSQKSLEKNRCDDEQKSE